MISQKFFFLACFFPFLQSLAQTQITYCELQWVSSGYGNAVKDAVQFSESDLVGRFFHTGTKSWFSGRVIPSKGKIFATGFNQELLESVTYQVLTNPGNKCVLTWENGFANEIPPMSVPVAVDGELCRGDDQKEAYIGRSLPPYQTGGQIFKDHSALFISSGKFSQSFKSSREFQVLTSVYPLLNLHLHSFTLDETNLFQPNDFEFIGDQKVLNWRRDQMNIHIFHAKNITEEFRIEEDNTNMWNGVGHLQFELPAWYKEGFFHGSQQLPQGQLVFPMMRDLSSQIDADIPGGTSSTPSNTLICSWAHVANVGGNNKISFQAIGTFNGPNLTSNDVQELLTKLGYSTVKKTEGSTNSADADITGAIQGKFAHSLWVISLNDNNNQGCTNPGIPFSNVH